MISVTFLGTGSSQGIPNILSDGAVNFSSNPKDKRLRAAIVVSHKDHHYFVDCGPDFRQQVLRNPFPKIDRLFFTHEHADHTAGLDDIRAYCYQQGAVPIYGEERLLKNMARRFAHIFATENRYPGAPSVVPHTITADTKMTLPSGLKLKAIRIMHGTLPILGYRFGDFAYLTDTKTIPESSFLKLTALDTLVISAFKQKPHRSHLNLSEAVDLIQKINPKRAYLTHISHHLGFHEEVSQKLPKNIFLAYDGLRIKIRC